ncbi:hypothetical protein [Streptomyces sp. NPDC021562]|uniref:hypothetical protein n=1 Tax=Streptomyces sp. NPDC021562 TaxID=3155121 RepID=UPI0033E3E9C5
MTLPEHQTGAQGTWPELPLVQTPKQFRTALTQLRESRNISLSTLERASEGGPKRLSPSTVSQTLSKDALPQWVFVVSYLRACGLSETEQEPWLTLWRTLNRAAPADEHPPEDVVPVQFLTAGTAEVPASAGSPAAGTAEVPASVGSPAAGTPDTADAATEDQGAPPTGGSSRWARLAGAGRRRLRAGLVVGTVFVLAAAIVAWQVHERDREDFKKQHCGTFNPDLVTGPDGECTGVTDGSDGSAVFGSDLKPVMKAIGAENSDITQGGDYVTFAFLTPLTSADAHSLTIGQYVAELEGAYTAVEEQNKENARPKIRLLVASMGSSEQAWRHAVDQLVARKDAEHLVAVAGLGLSQGETVEAARELSRANLPMVGDLITADGFDATGAVDGNGPINGLARVALSNSDQLTAISKELGTGPRTAALVSTDVTPNGSSDLYTASLHRGFRTIDDLKKHLDPSSDFKFDPRGGPGAILPTISQNFCNTSKTIDTVYYAARVKYLPQFLDALAQRSCHAQPITVVTGSDAAALDPKIEALHTPDAPITVLYASFPDAAQFRSASNPDRDLYNAFVKDFTSSHHDQQFPAQLLTSSYWAIVAHDAVLTAATALHNAAAHGDGPTSLPNRFAVRNELYALRNNAVAGASGHFGIDANGNRTRTDTVTTVHRLGRPLPKPPATPTN